MSTYVPFSNMSVKATCNTSKTRIDIKICRIDFICDTSSNSVITDERIRKTFVGNADDDLEYKQFQMTKRLSY